MKSNSCNRGTSVYRILIISAALALASGCGVAPVRHTPKLGAISGEKMPDLHRTQPIDVKSGECSSEETKIGTAGVGRVMGNLAEWTGVATEAAKKNLTARGATVTPGAQKVLIITMTKAEVNGNPLTGFTKGKVSLMASSPDGLNSKVEGSSSSMAPLSAVDGAVTDATRKLLTDSAVNEYLRK